MYLPLIPKDSDNSPEYIVLTEVISPICQDIHLSSILK
jgi:hypothetical protein